METLVSIFLLLLFVFGILSMLVRVVPEYNRLVLLRMGRSMGARGPGIVLLIPFLDRGIKVDLRETFFDVPPQTCITADNASVSIDFLVYDKVIDPVRSVLEVENFNGAARGLAITTLRAVVGSMSLDDVLSKRDEINTILHQKLDDVTDRWGIRVMAVEIREVIPPRNIEEAMTRQMASERMRRATVVEANGNREAAIIVAEGERQAIILRAEGERQATILNAEGQREASIRVAEGERQAIELRAQGTALGLAEVFKVAQNIDSKTLTLQYLEALRALGQGAATKFVIPAEFINLTRPLVANAAQAMQEDPKES
jgi:regulator of protease activity HflC (stomatin/prohibitin superfamily)